MEGSNGRGLVASIEENGNTYRVLVGKPEGNILLQDRPRRRLQDNIKKGSFRNLMIGRGIDLSASTGEKISIIS